MYIYDAFFIISTLSSVAFGFPDVVSNTEHVACGSYYSVARRDRACRSSAGGMSIFELLDWPFTTDTLTSTEILLLLERSCSVSPGSQLATYRDCVLQMAEECPAVRQDLTTIVDKRIAMYCENGHPSNWLTRALSRDMTFTSDCYYSFAMMLLDTECSISIQLSLDAMVRPNLSSQSNLNYRVAMSDWMSAMDYDCIRSSAITNSTMIQECSGSWPELSFWISLFTLGLAGIIDTIPDNITASILSDLNMQY